jgi:isocitrate lyase
LLRFSKKVPTLHAESTEPCAVLTKWNVWRQAKPLLALGRGKPEVNRLQAEDYTSQRDWYAPIVADAEAGFGGSLNCFELMKAYIEAGVAGVHFEDQLGSEKKCGHMGGKVGARGTQNKESKQCHIHIPYMYIKVLIPTAHHIRHLNAARLAADVCGAPTIIVARTDAESARLITKSPFLLPLVPIWVPFAVTLTSATTHSSIMTQAERPRASSGCGTTTPFSRALSGPRAMLPTAI